MVRVIGIDVASILKEIKMAVCRLDHNYPTEEIELTPELAERALAIIARDILGAEVANPIPEDLYTYALSNYYKNSQPYCRTGHNYRRLTIIITPAMGRISLRYLGGGVLEVKECLQKRCQ